MSSIVVLDNGAGKLKAGLFGGSQTTMQIKHSNCTARVAKQMNVAGLTADEVDSYLNGSLLQYTRPFERGYLTNWSCESDVWNRVFGRHGLNIKPTESILVVTDAPFTPEPLQNDMNEVIFEEFEFQQCLRRPSAWFSAYEFANDPPLLSVTASSSSSSSSSSRATYPTCCTVVDSGFSCTHVMPFIHGTCQKPSVKRISVGGKLLTNYLKELVSYRQWNMMDEFKIMNQVKEELCYVSKDFSSDLIASNKRKGKGIINAHGSLTAATISSNQPSMDGCMDIDPSTVSGENMRQQRLKRFFVLPDYQKIMRGFVKPDDEEENMEVEEQLLAMETERFSVPEVLFNPSDVGINQAGVAEATAQCLSLLSPVEASMASNNIVLTGGNVMFPQFRQRFISELRPLVNDAYPVNVYVPAQADNYAWKGSTPFQ